MRQKHVLKIFLCLLLHQPPYWQPIEHLCLSLGIYVSAQYQYTSRAYVFHSLAILPDGVF
jgi:hypothetical protein